MAVMLPEAAEAAEAGDADAGGRAALDARLASARSRATASYRMPKRSGPRQSRVGQRDYNAGGGQTISVGHARALNAASGAKRASQATWGSLPSSGRSPVTQTITKLIVAVAAGLVVLEVISQMTGQYFSYDLKKGAGNLKTAGTYVGLYPGQQAKFAPQAAQNPIHPTPGVAHG